ncbi:MAG: 2TM domain-containing protein [Nitrososphaerota archaeon]|nr:2TM domain-containing protein [Candidatus Geocrenenecus dongiae]
MSKDLTIEEFEEAMKELRVKKARRDFTVHFISYIIVNAFLVFVNLWTSPRVLWFPWVLAAWGVGLAFHYLGSRPSTVLEEVEKEIASIEYHARKQRKTTLEQEQ